MNEDQKTFKALMELAEWSAAEAARQIKMTPTAVHYILKGRSNPRPVTIELLRSRVIAFREARERDEREGAGGKYPQPAGKGIVIEDERERGAGSSSEESLVTPSLRLKLNKQVNYAPVISWASAGNARAFIDQEGASEWMPTACKDECCYAVIVEGDSMEPKFGKGDMVFVAPQGEARNGNLVIAKTKEEEIFFKLYHWTGHMKDPVKLSSLNPAYPVMELNRRDIEFIQPVHSVLQMRRHDL